MSIFDWFKTRRQSTSKPVEQEDPKARENRDFNRQQQAAYEAVMLGLATGSIDRAKNSVTVVQATSSAVLAIYTGMLGFVYSATTQALPFVAIVTPIFLGAAIVLAAYYTSFMSPQLATRAYADAAPPTIDSGSPDNQLVGRISAVVAYVTRLVRKRAWALRAAVVSLAVGLVAVTLPFVEPPRASAPEATNWVAVALPTEVPSAVAPDLRAAYFAAQIADAQAAADAQRKDTSPPVANPLDQYTWWIILGGAALVLLAALPGLIVSAKDRRADRSISAALSPPE